jgi:nucleoside-diphosphate-sugar epimerase
VLAIVLYVLLKPVDYGSVVVMPNLTEKTNHNDVDWAKIVRDLMPATGERYLVIGVGFLGKKLIHALLLRGETKIVAMDMNPTIEKFYKDEPRVTFVQGDVTKPEDLDKALKGVTTVYSTFAIIRFMDRLPHLADLSYRINVGGTEQVIAACQRANVPRLIQTSTSNTCVGFGQSGVDMDEKSPYVTRENGPHHYSWTKAIAEQRVLAANGSKTADGSTMITGAVRPCSAVFGAQDTHFLQGMLEANGTMLPHNAGVNLIDCVFCENVVYCHLCLENEMQKGNSAVEGQVYCASNEQPLRLVDFVATLAGFCPGFTYRRTPEKFLRILSYGVEYFLTWFPRAKIGQLLYLQPAGIAHLDLVYVFSSKKAIADLNYKPVYSVTAPTPPTPIPPPNPSPLHPFVRKNMPNQTRFFNAAPISQLL